jgi:hypothetical protein
MVRRKDVPVLLTAAALGVGVGIGMWLMRERIRTAASRAAKAVEPAARRLGKNPLDVFSTDFPDDAFEGVANYPHMPEGWRPKRGVRD